MSAKNFPSREEYLRLLELCYGEVGDARSWLPRVSAALSGFVDDTLGFGVSQILDRAGERRFIFSERYGRMSDDARADQNIGAIEALDEQSFRLMYRGPSPVFHASSLVRRASENVQQQFRAAARAAGGADFLALLAYPSPDIVLSISAPIKDSGGLNRRRAMALQRIALHLEAAFRVREQPQSSIAAVFSAPGRELSADADTLNAQERRALGEAARRMDRVRARGQRLHDVRKPGVWPALVQGRWTLAERCESDGQRHYVAYENAPHTWSSRALTRLEARSVELLGEGYMGYEIARMLQRSEARISECLSSASAKLALRGTADLSQLAAELGASERQPLRVTVTPAERRVLELVRLGYSNQEIAQRLQRSERTIAHQVSALLAKFGSVSRRVLIVAAHRN